MVFVSVVVSFSDTYSDYNDPQCLDKPGDMVNGVSSVAVHAMNSSAAINDNRLNAQRQLHRNGCVTLYINISIAIVQQSNGSPLLGL